MNPVRPFLSFAALTSLSSALALGAIGCGDDSEEGGTPQSPNGPWTVSGVLTYERVPFDPAQQGLDYTKIAVFPIRHASVRLINVEGGAEIAAASSGDDGAYTFTYEGPARVKLWIYSETTEPAITVEDNTADNAVYVLESAEIDASKTDRLDVVAATGWDGNAYAGPRQAAPFAVLDSAYEAARRFRAEVTPAPDFPALKLNWSANNRPEDGPISTGAIGTSFWDGQELYILGKDGVDTDEFDSHVIVHEWGHYFESTLARSDSPGGPHTYGDYLDPRIALSEGWGNALSAMILDPDTRYADSYGQRQSQGFSYDLEANDTSQNAAPGWYSESTVESVLFDVYDPANEPWDQVALGLPGVYAAMTGPVRDTAAMTTLFAFVAGLKSQQPAVAGALDALVTHHTYDQARGVSPIQDEWGTGEQHTGGFVGTLPVVVDGDAGGAINLAMTGGTDPNKLAQNRFIKVTGAGGQISVSSTCASDVDLYVYRSGVFIASGATLSGDEQVTFSAASGTTYVINVQGYENAQMDYTAVIDVTK